jgi:hypothetical protein
MATWDYTDLNQLQGSNKAIDTALSAHEREVFEQFLHKQSAEKAQAGAANDLAPDTLRYLFAIFH